MNEIASPWVCKWCHGDGYLIGNHCDKCDGLGYVTLAVEQIGSPVRYYVSAERHKDWTRFRNEFVAGHPFCAACGKVRDLALHHLMPFHLFPSLELEPSNCLVLCEGKTMNCHFVIGHGGKNWRAYNPAAVRLARAMCEMIDSSQADQPVDASRFMRGLGCFSMEPER